MDTTLQAENSAESYLHQKTMQVLASRAVRHPFFDWYACNRLTKDQERLLFSECYYWFKDLPFYVASISTLTKSMIIFKEIMLNVADEVCGEKTHAQLYKDFLGRIGINLAWVEDYRPSAATKALNSGMQVLYGTPPVEKALGALFFDEVMSAEMVAKVANGLTNQGYSEDDLYFWILHIEVEKGHSTSVNRAFLDLATDVQNRYAFEKGFNELEELVEGFWNNIMDTLVDKKSS